MAEFNENTQNEKVKRGFRGGPFFKNPMTNNKLGISDGYPADVALKVQAKPNPASGSTRDTWFSRKN